VPYLQPWSKGSNASSVFISFVRKRGGCDYEPEINDTGTVVALSKIPGEK
jgi:hypothetical protein